jgi:hypothetical protein
VFEAGVSVYYPQSQSTKSVLQQNGMRMTPMKMSSPIVRYLTLSLLFASLVGRWIDEELKTADCV